MISARAMMHSRTLPRQLSLQRLVANRTVSSTSSAIDVVHTFKSGELAGRTLQIQTDRNRGTMAYSIGFANERAGMLSESVKTQLASSKDQLILDFAEEERRISSLSRSASSAAAAPDSDVRDTVDTLPMPRTLEEAMEPSSRAIVVTEVARPFSIVHVNEAWEGLCGYTRDECVGKSLGTLLQGAETDRRAVSGIMSQLLRGEEAGAVLTNYRKGGEPFRNRLRVSPLRDQDKVTHFVGVLGEVHDEQYAST